MSVISNFEDTIEDIKNRFLANPEHPSFIARTIIELDKLIEKTHDEINSGRLIALKKFQNNNLITQSTKPTPRKTALTRMKLEAGQKQYFTKTCCNTHFPLD